MKSRLNLLGRRLSELTQPAEKSIMQLLAGALRGEDKAQIDITLPEREFVRADAFVEDIKEMTALRYFDLGDVIAILFEDFIDQVRHGVNQRDILQNLKERRHYITQESRIRELRPVALNHWQVQEETVQRRIRCVTLTIKAPTKTIRRAETLLYDLEEIDPSFKMTVEDMVTILILDLVNEVKRGNGNRYVQGIIERMEGKFR